MKTFLHGILLGAFCLSVLITARTAIASFGETLSCPAVGACDKQTILCSANNAGCTAAGGTNNDNCICDAKYKATGDICGCGYWYYTGVE